MRRSSESMASRSRVPFSALLRRRRYLCQIAYRGRPTDWHTPLSPATDSATDSQRHLRGSPSGTHEHNVPAWVYVGALINPRARSDRSERFAVVVVSFSVRSPTDRPAEFDSPRAVAGLGRDDKLEYLRVRYRYPQREIRSRTWRAKIVTRRTIRNPALPAPLTKADTSGRRSDVVGPSVPAEVAQPPLPVGSGYHPARIGALIAPSHRSTSARPYCSEMRHSIGDSFRGWWRSTTSHGRLMSREKLCIGHPLGHLKLNS
jgi:hypothetical protein